MHTLAALAFIYLTSLPNNALAASITWTSPSSDDSYSSGDTIVGQWKADKEVVSPSFHLCIQYAPQRRSKKEDDDDSGDAEGTDSGSCGDAVWPTVEQSSDNSYMIHMSLPNITSNERCYLEMIDDFGQRMSSPTFSLSPGDSSKSALASGNSKPMADPSSDTNATSPYPTTSASNIHSGSDVLTSMDESRIPVPTAAYAVPLSLVLSVLLVAGGLAFHQRRKLRAERIKEQEDLKSRHTLSRQSTLSHGGGLFMALGVGRPASDASQAKSQSRSTSVNMMRAWQRDVSLHERRDQPSEVGTRIDDLDGRTYVARADDGRSVVSGASRAYGHPRREPRRMTREPFHPLRSEAHPATVPAGVFRESPLATEKVRDDRGFSSRRRHVEHEEEDWGKLKRSRQAIVTPEDDCKHADDYLNATANDDLISSYYDGFSPVPLSPTPPSKDPYLSRPERSHVRKYVDSLDYDKALPPSR